MRLETNWQVGLIYHTTNKRKRALEETSQVSVRIWQAPMITLSCSRFLPSACTWRLPALCTVHQEASRFSTWSAAFFLPLWTEDLPPTEDCWK